MNLEKLLENRFWILLPLSVVLAVVGWWMGTSHLADQAQARVTAVEQARTNVQAVVNGNPPSDADLSIAQRLEQYQAELVGDAWLRLYEGQQASLQWPEEMPAPPPLQWPEGTPSGAISGLWRERYAALYYPAAYDALEETLAVYDAEREEGVLTLETALPEKVWRGMPSTLQVWEAQEDYWCMQVLAEAIAQVNRGARSRRSAAIRSLVELVIGQGSQGGGGGLGMFSSGGAAAPLSSGAAGVPGGSGGASGATGTGGTQEPTGRYIDGEQYRGLPFRLSVEMEHTRIPDLLIALAESSVEQPGRPLIPIQITEVSFSSAMAEETRSRLGGEAGGTGAGTGGFLSGSPGGRGTSATSRSAQTAAAGAPAGFMEGPRVSGGNTGGGRRTPAGGSGSQPSDPTLAQVTIVGEFYFFKPPPEAAVAAPPAATGPGAASALESEQPAQEVVPEEPPAEEEAPEETEAEAPAETSEAPAEPQQTEDAADGDAQPLPEDLTDEVDEAPPANGSAPGASEQESEGPSDDVPPDEPPGAGEPVDPSPQDTNS